MLSWLCNDICAPAMQAVIVDMCVGEGCIFHDDAVGAGLSAFLHCALRWQTREAQHVMSQSLAWVRDVLAKVA